MKKSLINAGVVILFYSVIIFGVLLLNARMSSLNNEVEDAYLAMNLKAE